jgi:hypothetical protein
MAVAHQLLTDCTESNQTRYAANLERLRQGRKRRLDSAGSSSSNSDEDAAAEDHQAWTRKALRLDLDSIVVNNNTANNNINSSSNSSKKSSTADSKQTKEGTAVVAPFCAASEGLQRTTFSSSTSTASPTPTTSATPRSVSPSTTADDLDCRRLPIMKRYLRSVLPIDGVSRQAGPSAAPASPAAVMTPLISSPPAAKTPCLRAGVIRHSSNPQRCLAFYYMPKKIFC